MEKNLQSEDALKKFKKLVDEINVCMFITNNKSALLNSNAAYQLTDASNETFRFMQYAGLKPQVKPMVQNTLSTSTMLGADSGMWLAAAQAVKYYDNSNCAQYGVCNYEDQLASAVLKTSYNCSPTLRLRSRRAGAPPRR